MFRELLDKVRIQGHIKINDGPFVRDLLPIIYTCEAKPEEANSIPYYNSGGRSIILEKGDISYRIKGCDPEAKLVKRIAESCKNRIEDVTLAHDYSKIHFPVRFPGEAFMFTEERPFGLLNLRQARCEKNTLEKLAQLYEIIGIENPCEFVTYKETGINVNNEKTLVC